MRDAPAAATRVPAVMPLAGEAPLIAHATPHACVATRGGVPISAEQFIGDVLALATRLPDVTHVLNSCRDRYAFAVTFCAALAAHKINLLPPSRTPGALRALATHYPSLALVIDSDDDGEHPTGFASPLLALTEATSPAWPPPLIPRDRIAAIAFTSGSTGEPQPQPKRWGGVVDGARAEIIALGLDALINDHVLVGTVSAQHMYGLESTVIMALHGPCAFAAEHPLHPQEVIDVLAAQSGRRVLITTPVHLRALAESGDSPPPLACVVSATAPLSDELAARCEAAWQVPVMEVYGCTETGMVATRRTVDGPVWQTMRDVRIEQRTLDQPTPSNAELFWAGGGHVAQPGPLMDRLRLLDASRFELLGRADDVINIGGKRASLQGLTRTLLSLPGVTDAVMLLPEQERADREPRLAAFVVAPGRATTELRAELRTRFDAVFVPRPLIVLPSLPRNAQGKLPRSTLLELLSQYTQRPKS